MTTDVLTIEERSRKGSVLMKRATRQMMSSMMAMKDGGRRRRCGLVRYGFATFIGAEFQDLRFLVATFILRILSYFRFFPTSGHCLFG